MIWSGNHSTLVRFLMDEASPENGIDPMSIQSVIQDEVVFCVVTDMVAIVTGYIWLKYLCLEINEQISIPWVSCAYQEHKFIQK